MGAQGSATLDFGAHPGAQDVTLDVTGQTGFVSTSLAEAWLMPKATSSANGTHSADEHRLEEIDVKAAYQADGTIRIYGRYKPEHGPDSRSPNAQRLYGPWNVAWVWN